MTISNTQEYNNNSINSKEVVESEQGNEQVQRPEDPAVEVRQQTAAPKSVAELDQDAPIQVWVFIGVHALLKQTFRDASVCCIALFQASSSQVDNSDTQLDTAGLKIVV